MKKKLDFKNSRDAYYSEGNINIRAGWSFEDVIKLMTVANLDEAKKIDSFLSIGTQIYGKDFAQKINQEDFDKEKFWNKIQEELSRDIRLQLNLEKLDFNTQLKISRFYDYLIEGNIRMASKISFDIQSSLKNSDEALAFDYFLKSEVNKYRGEFSTAYKNNLLALELFPSRVYITNALLLSSIQMGRPDLTEEILDKYYRFITLEENNEELWYAITTALINLRKTKMVLDLTDEFLVKYENEGIEKSVYGIYFLHNNISAHLHQFLSSKEEEDLIFKKLYKIKDLIEKEYGSDSMFMASSFHFHMALLYKKKADFKVFTLRHSTGFLLNNELRLKDDEAFIHFNYDLPMSYINKALHHLVENIKIKSKNKQINLIGSSFNKVEVYRIQIQLYDLFEWKIEHVCKMRNLDVEREKESLKDKFNYNGLLNEIENLRRLIQEKLPYENYPLATNVTRIGDFLYNHPDLHDKSFEYYKLALELFPSEMQDYEGLKEYLKIKVFK